MTSKVADAWGRIIEWLRTNASSDAVKPFPQTMQPQIDEFQTRTGIRLPQQLLDLYAALHVSGSSSAFPSSGDYEQMAFAPMPLSEVLAEWTSQKELVEMGQFDDCEPVSDQGIANVWWDRGWIPFASNGGGDFFCIDTAPTESGVAGQVTSHSHESGRHYLLAMSLESYLHELANKIESGGFVFNDRYGFIPDQTINDRSEQETEEAPSSGITEWHVARGLRMGEEAFKNKDYAKCVQHLSRIEEQLGKLQASRLAFARKKLQEPR